MEKFLAFGFLILVCFALDVESKKKKGSYGYGYGGYGGGPDVLSVIICEHGRKTIRCPDGQVVKVLKASYGRHNRDTCSNPSILTTNCHAGSSLSKVQSNCDNQASCELFASNSVFGDPCFGTFKYLEVKYKCVKGGFSKDPCDNYQELSDDDRGAGYNRLTQKSDNKLKRKAWYRFTGGAGDKIASTDTAGKCLRSPSCGAKYPGILDTSHPWDLETGKEVKGTICFAKSDKCCYKKLTITIRKCEGFWIYELPRSSPKGARYCGNKDPDVLSVIICEHGRKTIRCPDGQVIKVLTASYGRHNRDTCSNPSIVTTNCHAGSSLSKVQSNCDNQASCELFASNSVFGDPCVGTFKYLEVKYKCVKGPEKPVCDEKKLLFGLTKKYAAKSCKEIKEKRKDPDSGVYWIKPDGITPVKAYCDQQTDGGGWTLVYSYTFTNFRGFDSGSNAITPRPTWPISYDSGNINPSTTPPESETDYNAMDFKYWKNLGHEFMVKSNINHWIACKEGTGSLVEFRAGSLQCRNIKNVAPKCHGYVPDKLLLHSAGNPAGSTLGPEFVRSSSTSWLKTYYYLESNTRTGNWPTHDPCGTNGLNHLKNVNGPHGNIYIRE